MKKKSEVIKYKIMLGGDEKIFNGKKEVKGFIYTLDVNKRICISYYFKNKEVDVIVENYNIVFGRGDILINGFVRERGESKYTFVGFICVPI